MPLNQIEKHPFIEAFNETIDNNIAYEGIIIGSFPIHAITNDINQGGQVAEMRFNLGIANMKFFYGSKKSELWSYVAQSLGLPNPTVVQDVVENHPNVRKQQTIDFLHQNKLLISDVIIQTNRNGTKSGDIDLLKTANVVPHITNQFQLNEGLVELIMNFPSLKNLYFTAKPNGTNSPFSLFRKICGNDLTFQMHRQNWSATGNLKGKPIKMFFLPTPKARGIHFTDERRNQMFVNYLEQINPVFYTEIDHVTEQDRTALQTNTLSYYRNAFLVESYRQVLVHQNMGFEGAI